MEDRPGKHRTSAFIPYRKQGDEFAVFLQRRCRDAALFPGYLGFFGGHIEKSEKPKQALLREIKEELNYVPTAHRFFGKYVSPTSIKHVFIEDVGDDFERHVTVIEGEYGKFFTESDVQQEPLVREENKFILRDLFRALWERTSWGNSR
ncbi:MAG TPA: NUDIX domain-containing protein [Candidatus Methylomirabilis sp.]|nr:NUDIX domain-containing protein [Candidatus Methylomirabilis sp.]